LGWGKIMSCQFTNYVVDTTVTYSRPGILATVYNVIRISYLNTKTAKVLDRGNNI